LKLSTIREKACHHVFLKALKRREKSEVKTRENRENMKILKKASAKYKVQLFYSLLKEKRKRGWRIFGVSFILFSVGG